MNVTSGIALMHTVAETPGWTLVHFIWQGVAIGCLMFLLLSCIRRDRSRVRYGVCCAGLLMLAIAPVASGFYLSTTIEPSESRAGEPHFAQSTESGTDAAAFPFEPVEPALDVVSDSVVAESDEVVAIPSSVNTPPNWIARARAALPWLVGCWLAGVVVLLVRLLCGLHRVHVWRSDGSEPEDGTAIAVFEQLCDRMKFRQCVRLLESARATVPTVIGWLRPTVLVPTSMLTNLTAAELEAIFAHELAHIRRHDYAINLLQTVLETLLFFHPVVWWLSRQTRIEREHCCDDIAIGVCDNRPALARALAKMEELRCADRQLVAASGGALVTRIRRILQKEVPDRSGWPGGVATLLAIAALVVTSALSVAGPLEAELNSKGTKAAEDVDPVVVLPNEAINDDDETEEDEKYPMRKTEARKTDSKTGIKKSVFTDIRLAAWHPDKDRERRKASVDMVYSNVFNYTFIPQRIAKKLNATVLGEIDFGDKPPAKKPVRGKAQLMDLLASAPGKGEPKRWYVVDIKGPVGDEKIYPYATDAMWIPGHLEFYGMNKTKQHVFKIVRLSKVNVGVGPSITNVNALVLDDENSDFGVLGRNWSKRVRGKNGESLWFAAEGVMQLMAATKPVEKKTKADTEPKTVEKKELPAIKIVGRDGKRLTHAVISALELTRAERQFFHRIHNQLRKQRGLPPGGWTTSRETVVAGRTNAWFGSGMDTNELTISVPEDTGMRAELSGENIVLQEKRDRTIITMTRGRVELIDESGVIRAKASADGGAELLIIDATVSNKETVLVMKTKRLKDDGQPAPPVQVRVATDTGARADDDVPHRGIRYTFEKPDESGGTARLRRSIHLDMERLGKELSDDKDDNQNASSGRTWDWELAKAAQSWGPAAKSGDLRARLGLVTKNPRVGEPLRFKLELKNFGTEPEKYDAQYYAAFRVLRVTNVASDKSDHFVGMTSQTSGGAVPLAAGGTVTLWETLDAAELFMLSEGTYKIRVASPLRNGSLPASNELTVKVAGKQTPTKRLLGELIRIAPENWSVNKAWGGGILVSHQPTGLKRDVTTVQMWFTEEPLADDFKLGSGDRRQNVTTIGQFGKLGHLHIGALPRADKLWPNHAQLLTAAARKTLTQNQ